MGREAIGKIRNMNGMRVSNMRVKVEVEDDSGKWLLIKTVMDHEHCLAGGKVMFTFDRRTR